jgi:hypothetical protein
MKRRRILRREGQKKRGRETNKSEKKRKVQRSREEGKR